MPTLSFLISTDSVRFVTASGGGGGYVPSLDFSLAQNSQYIPIIFF